MYKTFKINSKKEEIGDKIPMLINLYDIQNKMILI